MCFHEYLKLKLQKVWVSNKFPTQVRRKDFCLFANILERLKSITVNLANFQFICHHQKCMVWSYKTFIVTSIIIKHRTHRKQNFKIQINKPDQSSWKMGSGMKWFLLTFGQGIFTADNLWFHLVSFRLFMELKDKHFVHFWTPDWKYGLQFKV